MKILNLKGLIQEINLFPHSLDKQVLMQLLE